MTEKQRNVIDVLTRAKGCVTASAISGELGYSVRAVKKYISEINGDIPNLITSTSKGYQIDRERIGEISPEDSACPQTSEERALYIIKSILQKNSGEEGFNIYDFAEELYVSYATVKRVLNMVAGMCQPYHLKLNISGDFFSLQGAESDKRRLMSSCYYQEFEKHDLSLASIQKVFDGYDIEWIKNMVINYCNKHHYYVNGYALVNLILDITISLDRIKKNFSRKSDEECCENIRVNQGEKRLAEEIIREFEQKYDVQYNELELQSFTLLLMSHLLRVDYKKIDYNDLDQIIGRECRTLVDEILQSTQEYYLLNMEDKELYIRFAMHIRSLLVRAKTGFINKNPLTETIKTGCPLLFDCAVSMSNIIRHRTGYEIVEDEIAYIALHIGTLLEMNEKSTNKLQCILIFPQYYDFSSRLERNLTNRFGNVLEIVNVLTNPDDLMNEKNVDLVISTVPLKPFPDREVAVINSWMTDRDYDSLNMHIENIRRTQKKQLLLEQLIAVTNPAMFHRNILFDSKEDIIRFMMEDMCNLGYADETYLDGILERERMSSTAFDYVAVPHSMAMNAKKTGMYIMLYDHPVLWGGKFVNIILLFTISKDEIGLFRNVFDNLVVLLMERMTLNRVLQSKTYNEFIKNVVDSYE